MKTFIFHPSKRPVPVIILFITILGTLSECHSENNPVIMELIPQDVTMDLINLDLDKFMIDGDEADGISSGLVIPKVDYRVTKVMYGDEMLWISEEGWECTHTEIHISRDNMMLVIGCEKDGSLEYKVKRKRFNGNWQDVDVANVDQLLFDMADEPLDGDGGRAVVRVKGG